MISGIYYSMIMYEAGFKNFIIGLNFANMTIQNLPP